MKLKSYSLCRKKLGVLAALALLALICPSRPAQADIIVQNGDTIAFLGDSITAFGAQTPGGYVNLVISGLAANGVKATAIPAGVSGNTSRDMLARLTRDVISKKPTWMTLSCGVNDVWHGVNGVDLPTYKTNIGSILDQVTAANIKPVILTSTMIHELPTDALNVKLADYNAFLVQTASDRKLPLADLNSEMQAEIAADLKANGGPPPGGLWLTVDGVHMNPDGNIMMATGILKAFGLSDAQIATARQSWLDIPASTLLSPRVFITLRQYQALSVAAAAKKISVLDYLGQLAANTLPAGAAPAH